MSVYQMALHQLFRSCLNQLNMVLSIYIIIVIIIILLSFDKMLSSRLQDLNLWRRGPPCCIGQYEK